MNEKKDRFKTLQTISVVVSIILTLGGVVIGIFNYFTITQLQPLDFRIKKIEANEAQVKEELTTYKVNQAILLDKLATKDQVNVLITHVDKISGRVDLLISKLIP